MAVAASKWPSGMCAGIVAHNESLVATWRSRRFRLLASMRSTEIQRAVRRHTLSVAKRGAMRSTATPPLL
jgi:hypothetical protein